MVHAPSGQTLTLTPLPLMSALGQKQTSASHASMSETSPGADIELNCVSVRENNGAVFLVRLSLLWNVVSLLLELGRDLSNPLRCDGILLE